MSTRTHLDEHAQYVRDDARNLAYRRAIESTVSPGDVVLDLGCGSGVLGMMALRAGAKRVFAVDSSHMVELARRNYQRNGFSRQVEFFNEHSMRVKLPELVDVVVADQMSSFGVGAGLLECFQDVKRRLMAPGGRFIPKQLDLLVSLIEDSQLREESEFWTRKPLDLDLQAMRDVAVHSPIVRRYPAERLLATEEKLISFVLGQTPEPTFAAGCELTVKRAGKLHGIGGWFVAHLAESVAITNSPLADHPIDREQTFYPLDQEYEVQPGDRVQVDFRVTPAQGLTSWRVKIFDEKAATPRADCQHSTFKSILRTSEELRRGRPDFAPALSAEGKARLATLELCNGDRTIAEIEQAVFESHSDHFTTRESVAEFVAATLARNAR
jgi:SAM-dependent methyltransferase